MNAKIVEQVYSELRAQNAIRLSSQVDFQVIAETLSMGEPMSLAQAIEKLRHNEFEGRRTIEVTVSFNREGPADIEFAVDANQERYEHASLEGAVNACLVANKIFSGTEEEADRVVQEAMNYQESRL